MDHELAEQTQGRRLQGRGESGEGIIEPAIVLCMRLESHNSSSQALLRPLRNVLVGDPAPSPPWTERRRRTADHCAKTGVDTKVGTPTHINWLPYYEVSAGHKKPQWPSPIAEITFADGEITPMATPI